MGLALKPEWYKAVPKNYKSRNPILSDDQITLDQYFVKVQDRDKNGEVCGERELECVTHESLMRYYREHQLPRGMSVSYHVESTDKNMIIIRCVLEKPLTAGDKRRLIEAYPEISPEDLDFRVHVEAIGEATPRNAKSEIASLHLANTAENRAFDRCLIKFLSIKENVYGSSEEIGESAEERADKTPARKDWLETAVEQTKTAVPVVAKKATQASQSSGFVQPPARTPVQVTVKPADNEKEVKVEEKTETAPKTTFVSSKKVLPENCVCRTRPEAHVMTLLRALSITSSEDAEAQNAETLSVGIEGGEKAYPLPDILAMLQSEKDKASAGKNIATFVTTLPTKGNEKNWMYVIQRLSLMGILTFDDEGYVNVLRA